MPSAAYMLDLEDGPNVPAGERRAAPSDEQRAAIQARYEELHRQKDEAIAAGKVPRARPVSAPAPEPDPGHLDDDPDIAKVRAEVEREAEWRKANPWRKRTWEARNMGRPAVGPTWEDLVAATARITPGGGPIDYRQLAEEAGFEPASSAFYKRIMTAKAKCAWRWESSNPPGRPKGVSAPAGLKLTPRPAPATAIAEAPERPAVAVPSSNGHADLLTVLREVAAVLRPLEPEQRREVLDTALELLAIGGDS